MIEAIILIVSVLLTFYVGAVLGSQHEKNNQELIMSDLRLARNVDQKQIKQLDDKTKMLVEVCNTKQKLIEELIDEITKFHVDYEGVN